MKKHIFFPTIIESKILILKKKYCSISASFWHFFAQSWRKIRWNFFWKKYFLTTIISIEISLFFIKNTLVYPPLFMLFTLKNAPFLDFFTKSTELCFCHKLGQYYRRKMVSFYFVNITVWFWWTKLTKKWSIL